jgi:hypothetical protein
MFIKPEELNAVFKENGLQNKEIKGTKRPDKLIRLVKDIRQYKKGKLSAAELQQFSVNAVTGIEIVRIC